MATVEIDDFTIETVYAGIAESCCGPHSASSATPPASGHPEELSRQAPPAPREDPHPHPQLIPPFRGNALGHFGKCAGRTPVDAAPIREMLEW